MHPRFVAQCQTGKIQLSGFKKTIVNSPAA